MELKEKNNVALWLYRYFTGDEYSLPKSICPLFWKATLGLISIILAPLVFLFIVLYGHFKYDGDILSYRGEIESNGLVLIAIQVTIIGVYCAGVIITLKMLGINYGEELVPLWVWLVGWLSLPIFVALLILFLYLLHVSYKGASNNIVTQGVSNWYDRVCTKIDWK